MQPDIKLLMSHLQRIRTNIQQIMDGFTLERCNKIPDGFNNNLIWNYGHVIVTQQLLVYGLSGMDIEIDKHLVDKFRKGTKPEIPVEQMEYEYLKRLFFELPNKTIHDIEKTPINQFNSYETSFGITLHSLADAISFNNIHEAMHLGIMMAIKKLI